MAAADWVAVFREGDGWRATARTDEGTARSFARDRRRQGIEAWPALLSPDEAAQDLAAADHDLHRATAAALGRAQPHRNDARTVARLIVQHEARAAQAVRRLGLAVLYAPTRHPAPEATPEATP